MSKTIYWNHRIVAEKDVTGEYIYSVREVHYEDDKPVSWTKNPLAPYGESSREVFEETLLMSKARNRPLLVVFKGKLVEHRKQSSLLAKAEEAIKEL